MAEPAIDAVARYRSTYGEFDALLGHAVATIELQKGRQPQGSRDAYGERIFGKLVCHALSLQRLSPSPAPETREFWDISSNYAIARALIETYEALSYIAIEDVQEAEREFRVLLWKLHAQERRIEMLRLLGSNHPDISELEASIDRLRANVLKHSFLPVAGADTERKVRRGETPPFHLSRAARDASCGVDNDYHRAVIMHLSSHVHTHPFSVQQLFDFQAGDPDCLRLMGIPLQYSSLFLAKAVVGMRKLFAPAVPPLTSVLQELLETSEYILGRGLKVAG